MTIREKISYLEAIEQVIKGAREAQRWHMDYKYNEEKSEYEYVVPTQESDEFEKYNAYDKLISDIEKLSNKL